MSLSSNAKIEEIDVSTATSAPKLTSKERYLRRRVLINILRVLVVVVILVGWEFLVRIKVIDVFFWGQPTGVIAQFWTWITKGAAQGPLCEQIAVTLEATF